MHENPWCLANLIDCGGQRRACLVHPVASSHVPHTTAWSRHTHISRASGRWHTPLHFSVPARHPVLRCTTHASPAMADSGVSRRLAPLVLLALAALVLPGPAAQSNSTELAAAGGGGAGTRRSSCTYTVKVKTSCGGESPRRTADAVGLAFGDAYRNEAHAPRLPNAGGAALGRCAIDTFRVAGPCGYGVCYLYLRRSGRDGWAPEWVQVVQPGPQPVTATFYFGDPLPEGVWYGHNRCPKAAAGGSSTNKPTAAKDNSSSASTRG